MIQYTILDISPEFVQILFWVTIHNIQYILRGKIKYTGNYFFYLSLEFHICTLIIDIIVKNNHLYIICKNFQEILSMTKEMTFKETNKGSKSTFA